MIAIAKAVDPCQASFLNIHVTCDRGEWLHWSFESSLRFFFGKEPLYPDFPPASLNVPSQAPLLTHLL